jgi:hypothetical protein
LQQQVALAFRLFVGAAGRVLRVPIAHRATQTLRAAHLLLYRAVQLAPAVERAVEPFGNLGNRSLQPFISEPAGSRRERGDNLLVSRA